MSIFSKKLEERLAWEELKIKSACRKLLKGEEREKFSEIVMVKIMTGTVLEIIL